MNRNFSRIIFSLGISLLHRNQGTVSHIPYALISVISLMVFTKYRLTQCYYFKWTVCSRSPQKWTVAQSFPIQMDWYLISHLPLIVYMLNKQCVLNNNFSAGDIFSTQFKRKCEACFCVMVSFKGNLTMTPIVKLLIVSRMRHCGTYILDLMG